MKIKTKTVDVGGIGVAVVILDTGGGACRL